MAIESIDNNNPDLPEGPKLISDPVDVEGTASVGERISALFNRDTGDEDDGTPERLKARQEALKKSPAPTHWNGELIDRSN
jgi:hypothetical protein